jgi:DegV family protein with EDD domain
VIEPTRVPSSTAVVADTTSYLPPDLLERHVAGVVSLYVGLEGEQQREADITDLDAFYERLRASSEAVTTSQPSVGDFIAVWEPLLEQGREIVSVHLSAAISGTVESAQQARKRLIAEDKGGERIEVVDSRSGAGGMALQILAVAKAAEEGASAAEAGAVAAVARERLGMWFAVDTLEYLRRGGRIGAARAWVGTALKIKPILTFEDEITPVERVRTRARAIERLADYAKRTADQGDSAWVVQHVQEPDTADRLADELRSVFGNDPVLVSEIGPVIGAHVGPGLLGVGGIPSELL